MKDKIDISFYHFTVTPLVVGLPKLIKKIYYTKQNLFIVCKTEAEMRELDRVLWTFASREFIPHGIATEANAELQPVLLSTDPNMNKNSAKIFLSSCEKIENLNSDFDKQLYAFYGNADEVKHMTDLHSEYKTRDNITALFWRQERDGKWSKVS